MFPTAEVRWFYRGDAPPAVLAWFERRQRSAEAQPLRVDHYLALDRDSLGVKLREGRIEIKQRVARHGSVRFHERATGLVEAWRKWSFELAGPLAAGPDAPLSPQGWIAVRKARRLCRYHLGGAGRLVSAPLDSYPAPGCDLELTAVRAGEQTWWTLGFESFGAETSLYETLRFVAGQILAGGESPGLAVQDSRSYPAWLAGLGG